MKLTFACEAVAAATQHAGVDDGGGWSAPAETPTKLSVLTTPETIGMTADGEPQEFDVIGVPQTERVHDAGSPLQA